MSEQKKHEKQQLFYADTSRTRWIFGGNRTGKTHAGAWEAVWWATGTHPTNVNANEMPRDGWVVSLSTQVQRDVAQQKVLFCLKEMEKQHGKSFITETVMAKGRKSSREYGIIDFIAVYHIPSGQTSKIGFKNCEQGREKFQGTSLDFVWFDEEPPEDVYEECLMRTLDRGGSIWGTMTPLKGRTWVYHRIYSPAEFLDGKQISGDKTDISCISMTWDDNPFLCEKEIKNMEKNYNKDALESRKYGRFIDGTGLCYPEFCEKNVSVPFVIPKGWYTYISIDPGYTDPTAVLWIAVSGDKVVYVVDEYVASGKKVSEVASEIIKRSELLGFEKNARGRFSAFIDSAAAARHYGEMPSVMEQFTENGIDVNPSVDKSVIDGVHRVKVMLADDEGTRRLVIFQNCEKLTAEMRGYMWGTDGRPVKKNDHCLDALRYFISTVAIKKQDLKPSEIEKYKNEMMRKNKF